jgi:hypothetical protein
MPRKFKIQTHSGVVSPSHMRARVKRFEISKSQSKKVDSAYHQKDGERKSVKGPTALSREHPSTSSAGHSKPRSLSSYVVPGLDITGSEEVSKAKETSSTLSGRHGLTLVASL